VIDGKSYAANKYLHGKTVAEVIGNHAERSGEAVTPEGKPDYAALLQRAQAIPNPVLRERVTAKIDRQRIIAEKAESAAREAMLERMHDAIETVDPTTPLEKAISPEAYAYARSHGDLAQLQARLDQRLKGEIVSDDPVLVNRLDNLAIDDPT